MATIQLANMDARLTLLALRYHLARPGAELDPETKQPSAHGLAEVADALEPQTASAVATIELSEYQRERLLLAISGTMNELKTYPLLDALPAERGGGRRSTVVGFDATLRGLFPEVAEDPEEAVQLAGHLLALRRRLGSATVKPTARDPGERTGGSWWRFWNRREE